MELRDSKVLITQAHLVRFMGSEMVTLELAEFFADSGADVVIATQTFGGPIKPEFEALPVRVYELSDDRLDHDLEDRLPDIAWVQHTIIPRRLLASPGRTRFVFNHMSANIAAEFTLSPEIEREFASAVLFVSPEARAVHNATGVYEGVPEDRLQIWANPAPKRFSGIKSVRASGRPRIAVVSNHLAPEVIEAVKSLRSRIDFSLIGAQSEHGAAPRRITPEVLGKFDAVVTIGKTVQYALVAGIPVYCYDHFGGPGWLNEENIDLAAETNFSGRGSTTKSASELAREIGEGLERARSLTEELTSSLMSQYSLPERMDALMSYMQSQTITPAPPSALVITAHENVQSALGEYIREWVREWGNATSRAALLGTLGWASRVTIRLTRIIRAAFRRIPFQIHQ